MAPVQEREDGPAPRTEPLQLLTEGGGARDRPQSLTNLRVRLPGGGQNEIPADLYVKVLEGEVEAGAFRVGFTSVPPEVEAFLQSLRPTG